jgi:hypothetical protein
VTFEKKVYFTSCEVLQLLSLFLLRRFYLFVIVFHSRIVAELLLHYLMSKVAVAAKKKDFKSNLYSNGKCGERVTPLFGHTQLNTNRATKPPPNEIPISLRRTNKRFSSARYWQNP